MALVIVLILVCVFLGILSLAMLMNGHDPDVGKAIRGLTMKQGFFQILSRQNDVNGNPYRLTMVYNQDAELVELVQERISTPNIVRELVQQGYVQLSSIHVSSGEYRSFIIAFKRILREG